MELTAESNRRVLLCNHNYSHEGILHPDRILAEYDLLYMVQGEWEIIEDERTYRVGPGQVILLEPHKHHYSILPCTPEMKNAYVHFEELAGDSSSVEAGLSEYAPEAGERLCLDKVTDCSGHPEIYHGIERIIECFWARECPNREYREEALLAVLLAELSDLSAKRREKADVVISEALHRIQCEPERFFTVEELAADYRISVRSFSGRFKKVTGQSVHQYQVQLKLAMAYDMLPMNPGRGLRDIARSFGFYDEFQFSRLFKKRYGISPSQRR